MADKYYLRQHIKKVCLKNLADENYVGCGTCPFEDEIVDDQPHLKIMFEHKRRAIEFVKEEKKKQLKLKL